MNKIYIVNKSYYDDEAGKNFFFSTEEKMNDKFNKLKDEYKTKETFTEDGEHSFGVDGMVVVKYSENIDED